MEDENKGITLKDICKTIWLKKWLALIVAVLVALACAVLINYVYNPSIKTYETEFSLNLPGSDNGAFYSYPDGKLFYYSEMTSVKTLNEIKEKGNFSNVNVDKMVKNGDISITRNVTVTPLSADGTNVYKETVYKVSAKMKYFGNANEAKEFLTSIAEYPAEYLKSMEINYDLLEGIDSYDNNMLKQQLEFLTQEYGSLITTYGNTFVVDGRTLISYAQEVTAYLGVETDVKQYEVETVKKLTETFKNTSKAVYAKATSVAFVQPNIIVEQGGMSLVKILLLSIIVGVIVALVAAYVGGYLSLKKKKAAGKAPSDGAPQGQPEVEAEISQTENKE